MTQSSAQHANDRNTRQNATPGAPLPRYAMSVPTGWLHYDGPLHGLLEFQEGKCAVCSVEAQWNVEDVEDDQFAFCSLQQWVEGGLVLGLVCALCSRRYKTLDKEPVGAAIEGLATFRADPPGQRCPATVGLDRQSRPRCFNSKLAPTEEPTSAWAGTNTVTHSLYLWQRGRCAICSTGLSVATRPRYVHVDHDAATGLIRGLLCHRCNICLGQDWKLMWWEHHAPAKEAYLQSPPAQICPATRGLTMAERKTPAELTWSADRQEILLDGMPKGIATPAPPQPTGDWYSIQYDASAPPGLPPVLEASALVPYSDGDGDWLAFLMDAPLNAASQQRRCILRVQKTHVLAVTQHPSLQQALAAAFPNAA